MRKTIIKYVSILLCILNVFVAVFGLWLFFEGFDNTTVSQWLYQCDIELSVWGIAIIEIIILVLSGACLTTSILMPYYYEWIYDFVEGIVYKWFPLKQTNTKEEPKIQATLIKSNPIPKVVVKETLVRPTITDLDHVSEVIAGGELDNTNVEKTPNTVVPSTHFVDNFDEYFPMVDICYYTWTFATEKDCERIRKSMLKDDKTAYFYEKNPKDRESLIIGIQTTYNAWRINRDENTNTKRYDYCIYDYVEDKQYLLVDSLEVNVNGKETDWKNYKYIYNKLGELYNFYNYNK